MCELPHREVVTLTERFFCHALERTLVLLGVENLALNPPAALHQQRNVRKKFKDIHPLVVSVEKRAQLTEANNHSIDKQCFGLVSETHGLQARH